MVKRPSRSTSRAAPKCSQAAGWIRSSNVVIASSSSAAADAVDVLGRDVDLDPAPDAPEHAVDRGIIARAAGIAVADHDMEDAFAGREAAAPNCRTSGGRGVATRALARGPIGVSAVVGRPRDRGPRRGPGGEPDGERASASGEGRDHHQRLRGRSAARHPECGPAVADGDRSRNADQPEGFRRPSGPAPPSRSTRPRGTGRSGRSRSPPGAGTDRHEDRGDIRPPDERTGIDLGPVPPGDGLVDSHSIGAECASP